VALHSAAAECTLRLYSFHYPLNPDRRLAIAVLDLRAAQRFRSFHPVFVFVKPPLRGRKNAAAAFPHVRDKHFDLSMPVRCYNVCDIRDSLFHPAQ